MNQRLLWTIAALLTTVLGTPSIGHATPTKPVSQSRVNLQETSAQPLLPAATNLVEASHYQSQKVYQAKNTVIARVQPHQLSGRIAATIYVRNIPVLTFFGSIPGETSTTKVKATRNTMGIQPYTSNGSTQTKMATIGNLPNISTQPGTWSEDNDLQQVNALIWEASAVAARINQLNLDRVNPRNIIVSWQAGDESFSFDRRTNNSPHYLIKYKDRALVEINAQTRLPDTTNNLEQDALQVTNRLRRLLGNAPALRQVADKPVRRPRLVRSPKLPQIISFVPVRISLSGMASWYGPGFHGRRTANGERYNQNALTAAHRSLPFGTLVRVTNVQTGRSVVVRITDRGPFIRGRIIDLSAAAAQIVGLMQRGVAPVRVEVLNNKIQQSAR